MGEGITPPDFREMKQRDDKITVLTAYDYPTANILDKTDIEAILVGDSLGNTVLGHKDTLSVTMDDMLHHTKAVARATENSLLIGDMPFISWQQGKEEAVRNAGRFIKEADAEAVKVEGGEESAEQIESIVDAGIPVMGHLGLTPQRILQFGGYQERGQTAEEARKIVEDAEMLEEIGVFSLVLESIPQEVGEIITEKLEIPTIGIGAGPHCDGQVLVLHDLLGLTELSPKFSEEYANLSSSIGEAVEDFQKDVKSEDFPRKEHSHEMEEKELDKLMDLLEKNP